MNNKPEIAIIESNTLTCLGLKSILEEIIPMATIRTFYSFSELIDDTPDMYAHYFISAQCLLPSPKAKNNCAGQRQSAIPAIGCTCTQYL